MNLLELAVKIAVDDQASHSVDQISKSLGNGLKKAAQAGIAAVTAAGAAVTAFVKQSIDAYAEYEQLVGGVETLFGPSSSKVQEYAARAYKTAGMSANEYMSTVTSFSASLLQSLAIGTSESTEITEEELERQYEALKESTEESEEALKESHDKEIKEFKALTDKKIELIDAQYMEQLRLIDEERYTQLKAIDDQISAINGLSEAEEKSRREKEREEKKAELQRQIDTASNARFKKAAEKNLSDYLEQIAKEDTEEERQRRIEQLNEEKKAINTEADEKKRILDENRKAEIKALEDSEKEQLEIIEDRHREELKALKAANKNKLKEMSDYVKKQAEYLNKTSSGLATYTEETYALAADYADIAITDMADNANKMGTSIETLQVAYAGFAKGNYTMLDNLKLGYGGTKSEMERLIEDANRVKAANGEMANLSISSFADIVEAIHIVQTEMGITGTTAAEAEGTISGSLASMAAAWENLKKGISDENAEIDKLVDDFVISAEKAADNLLIRVNTTIDGIEAIFDDPVKRQKFIDLGKGILTDIVRGLTDDDYAKANFEYVTGWLTGKLYEILKKAVQFSWDWFKSGGLIGKFISGELSSEDFLRGLVHGSDSIANSGIISWGSGTDTRLGPAARKGSNSTETSGTAYTNFSLIPMPGQAATVPTNFIVNNNFVNPNVDASEIVAGVQSALEEKEMAYG